MKRGKTLTILAAGAALAAAGLMNAQGGGKTTLCHYSVDEDCWVTIEVSNNAVAAHLAHGDSLDVENCPNTCVDDEVE